MLNFKAPLPPFADARPSRRPIANGDSFKHRLTANCHGDTDTRDRGVWSGYFKNASAILFRKFRTSLASQQKGKQPKTNP